MIERCKHLKELRAYLQTQMLSIFSEDGQGGWVNVECRICQVVDEVELKSDSSKDDPRSYGFDHFPSQDYTTVFCKGCGASTTNDNWSEFQEWCTKHLPHAKEWLEKQRFKP